MAEASASDDDDDDVQRPMAMKHNDLQLHELLKLARSCLKYERLPGELSMRGFFDKFDAEVEESERSKALSEEISFDQPSYTDATSQRVVTSMEDAIETTLNHLNALEQSLTRKPLRELIEESMNQIREVSAEMSPAPSNDASLDARLLKNQTAQLERVTAEAQKALDAGNAELSQDILKRIRLAEEEKVLETELQKEYHQLKLAKDMVKRQNGEMKTLYSHIQELKVLAASPAQTAPAAPGPLPTGPGRPKGEKTGRSRPGGRPTSKTGMAESADSKAADIEAGASVGAPSDLSVQTPRPPSIPPRLSVHVPPKERFYSSVLKSRTASDWKLYIP